MVSALLAEFNLSLIWENVMNTMALSWKRDCYKLVGSDLEIWDAELVVGGQIVGARGGRCHFVPCLLAGLLSRSRDQPKLCHDDSSDAAPHN